MNLRRTTAVVLASVLTLAGVALVPAASAVPVLVTYTCSADGPLIPRGTATVQVPFLGAVTFPVDELGEPIAQALGDTDLPLPLPLDVSATPSIDPGESIDYATSVSLDLGTAVTEVVDVVRDGLTAAGYEDLADTLTFVGSLDELTVPFPHPTGTSAIGTPTTAGSTGTTAVHTDDAMELIVASLGLSADGGADPLDLAVSWSVLDGGTTPPAEILAEVGDLRFVLDVEIGGTLPAELVNLLLGDALPFAVTGDVPVTSGARGPWSCTTNDVRVVATTAVVGTSIDLAMITGAVEGIGGDPLVDVEVFTARLGEADSVRRTSTDGDGRYVLADLIPGDYVVYATGAGLEPACYPVSTACRPEEYTVLSIDAAQVIDDIDLQLAPALGGSITGSVTDAGGTALAGVQVWVVGARFSSYRLAYTLPDGTYRVAGLGDGTYMMWFNDVGVASSCYPGPRCRVVDVVAQVVDGGAELAERDIVFGS